MIPLCVVIDKIILNRCVVVQCICCHQPSPDRERLIEAKIPDPDFVVRHTLYTYHKLNTYLLIIKPELLKHNELGQHNNCLISSKTLQ